MTKTNDAPRTARVVDTGSREKTISKAGLVPPMVKNGRVPRDTWKGVKKEEIGRGFEVIEPAELTTEKSIKRAHEKADPIWRNKFIKGSSPCIWYMVKAPTVKPKVVKKKKEPINFRNKLDNKTSKKFRSGLGTAIDQISNFMVKDVLPKSLAMHSGMDKAEELLQQILDDEKVQLPIRQYMQGKTMTAMHLRVIRFVSNLFELTPEEKKLMVAEFVRPWTES